MTQSEINRAVALVTGETLCTVAGLGFSIADPDFVDYAPEPTDIEDLIVGCAFPEGEQGLNVARLIAFLADLPLSVAGTTVASMVIG